MALRAIDGGTNYYAQFTNSFPTDPNFFPIGVWFESVLSQSDINLDKAVGLNTYVVLTTDSSLSLIQQNGMYAILQADNNDWKNNSAAIANPNVVGWLLHDEIDMQQANEQGAAAARTQIAATMNSLPNDGRLTYANYGKGVAFWNTDSDAGKYINDFQDVTSMDVYYFTDPNFQFNGWPESWSIIKWRDGIESSNPVLTEAEYREAANYGYNVDRMRYLDGLDGERQPIWNFVEVGTPFSGGDAIAIDEIQAAVMHSLIAGAQGIQYFNHSFGGPNPSFHVLRDPAYAAQRAAVDEINGLIEQLAPVLNSWFDDGYADALDGDVTLKDGVRVMSKFYDGDHYIFAGSLQHEAQTTQIRFGDGTFDGFVTVVGESGTGAWGQTIPVVDGVFTDTFVDGEAWVVYHVDENAAPPPPTSFLINEEFHPWTGAISPDGVWRIAGPWVGTGGNQLEPSNVAFTETYPGETSTGFMYLTIPSGNPLRGAELQSLDGYGYGTYEARMKVSAVDGGVASFFLIGAPDYRQPEFDIEFLLGDGNEVTLFNHPTGGGITYSLGFDPTAAFHNYGIIWTPNADGTATVSKTVDGVIVHSATSSSYVASLDGEFIMMNAWSGNANFGGGPPTQNSTTVYDWVHYTPYEAAPPGGPGSVSINDVTISEGNSGTKLAAFTATRTSGTEAFVVSFATSNGTATVAGSDYVAASGTLSFAAGQNTQTLSVTINGDTTVEANETFNVALSNATNGATISDAQGVGTITNDDSVPPPPGTNLVTNGGFETGSFSGWTLSGNTGGIYIAPTQFPGPPHSGTYSAGFGSFNSDGTITQNIATTAGQHYTFSFWIRADSSGSTPMNHFDAQWNGQTLLNLVNSPDTSYQLYTFDVIGNGGTSVLEFDGFNNPDTWRLDDVSLTAVGAPPPPDTTPPAKPAISSFSTDTGTLGDGRTTDTTLMFTGTAEASSVVTVFDGAASLGTTSANGSGAWTFSTAALSLATHTFTVKAADAAGNVSVASDPLAVTVEAPPPPPQTINGTSGHDTLRGGAGDDIINGNNGQDQIDGAAGNDLIHGGGGKDWIDGGIGIDTLWGDAGADEFVFKAGEAGGDTVADFSGNGSRTGDILMFIGFGDKQDGATFTSIGSNQWQIHSALDGHNEIITLAAAVHPNDFLFI